MEIELRKILVKVDPELIPAAQTERSAVGDVGGDRPTSPIKHHINAFTSADGRACPRVQEVRKEVPGLATAIIFGLAAHCFVSFSA